MPPWGHLGSILNHLGVIFGPPEGHLGTILGHLGVMLDHPLAVSTPKVTESKNIHFYSVILGAILGVHLKARNLFGPFLPFKSRRVKTFIVTLRDSVRKTRHGETSGSFRSLCCRGLGGLVGSLEASWNHLGSSRSYAGAKAEPTSHPQQGHLEDPL